MTKYLESNDILNQNQAGFRSGYCCQDHIFTIYSIIEYLKKKKKRLFCGYIDFSSAFDKVHRASIWHKLIQNNINGKVFQVIYNTYRNIKSCVSYNGSLSAYFNCENGVRQGENLSPILFSMFLNDMQSYIESNGGIGIELTDNNHNMLWLKLLLLLYADDTVIMSDCPIDFQRSLDAFNNYCTEWYLTVNLQKTKILIFGARSTNQYNFFLGNQTIDIDTTYIYLGVKFTTSGSFLNACKHITQQAKKALYLLYTKSINADLPLDLSLKLFYYTVLPILTYGSEIYGFENLDILEKVHNEFLRKVPKVRKSTPIYMLHGETGRYPISIDMKCKMIAFWSRLINGNYNKLSYKMYSFLLNQENTNFKWLSKIKQILDSVGLTHFWQDQFAGMMPLNLHTEVKRILIDQYKQEWQASVTSSGKGRAYHLFKREPEFEKYFKSLPQSDTLELFKFRTANHKLPIETGRWDGTTLENRKCNLCEHEVIGSE